MENLLLKYNQSEKDAIAKKVSKRFDLSKRYYDEKHDLWERCYKIYRAYSEEEGESDEPDIKIAFAFHIVEKIVAHLVSFFGGKLSIQVKPKKNNLWRQAENWYSICRDFFNSANHRLDYIESTRERVICGTCWEIDEWHNDYEDGFRWVLNRVNEAIEVNLPTFAPVVKGIVNAGAKLIRQMPIQKYIKKLHKFPIRVGYGTRYPSIFKIFPQPGITKMEDMEWIIEEQDFVSLETLRKKTYIDPETNETKQLYDLSYFDDLKKQNPEMVITPKPPNESKGYETFTREYSKLGLDDKAEAGVDGAHLLIEYSPRQLKVVANGNILILHVKDLYEKPGLKIRRRVYIHDRYSIYGIGAIELVIPMFEELDDVHNMSMQDWVRNIYQMLFYDEGAIPYPDDFEPRAGGKIRVRQGTDLPRAVMSVPQSNVTGTMITTESNLRGLIEVILSVPDFTPGVMGTKPYHKTYGGLLELQAGITKFFSTILLQDQAVIMQQMDSMYWLYDQFMFEPMTLMGPGGAVEFQREDIDTDGLGFFYVASDDPSFGDTSVQRNQNMVLLQTALNYVATKQNLGHLEWKDIRCDKIFEDVMSSFKHSDVSEYLIESDGSIPPDREFQFLLQGIDIQVNPKEDLKKHYLAHLLQMRRIESGMEKYPPEIVSRLSNHISDTQEMLQMVILHPDQFVDEEAKTQMATKPVSVGNVNLGQELLANKGGIS